MQLRPPLLRSRPAVRRRLVVAMAALGLAALGVVPLAASSAQASDPCVLPKARIGPRVMCPPPSPSTTDPPPTTTPPPTTAPTGPTFSSAISILDESGNNGLDHNVVGQWMSGGDFRDPRREGAVTWSDAAETEGTLNIVNPQPLGGPPLGLAIFESSNSPGSLCRTPTTNAIPFGPGHAAHVIVAPQQQISTDALRQLASGLTGSVDVSDIHVDIRAVQINPKDDGTLELIVDGTASGSFLGIGVSDNFTYEIQVFLIANKDATNPHDAIFVSSPFQGHLDLHDGTGTQWSPTDSDRSEFHTEVTAQATTAFNNALNNDPKVAFFSTLGYLPALRSIGVNSTGITLDPTLCLFN